MQKGKGEHGQPMIPGEPTTSPPQSPQNSAVWIDHDAGRACNVSPTSPANLNRFLCIVGSCWEKFSPEQRSVKGMPILPALKDPERGGS